MTNTQVTGKSGRRMGLAATGDPFADRLVVLCHPTPGAAAFDPDPVHTERWGVHVIAFDRPGYGASEPLAAGERPRMDALVDDIGEYLERSARNAERISKADFGTFGVIGWGTGGAVAAALAERLPDQVDRLALVSVPAKRRLHKCARRALIAPRTVAALHVAEDDRDLRDAGLRGRLDRMIDDAYAQGMTGIETDRVLMADESWSDGLGAIRAETALFYGAQDPVAGPSDGEWFLRRLPHATMHVAEGSGPLAIAAQWEDILAHVAPRQGAIQERYRDHGTAHVESPRPEPPGSAPTP